MAPSDIVAADRPAPR